MFGSSSGAAAKDIAAKGLTIRWFGQACFLITSPKGVQVLMDPIPNNIGYTPSPVKADVVTISHEHFDHNNVKLAQGSPKIFHGLADGGKSWNKVDTTIGDVHIRNAGVYHDTQKGAQRGLDSVFVLDVNGITIVHLGDIGHMLNEAQIKDIGKVDVLLIPVGGFYTIDAGDASRIVEQLKPTRLVIPMHYKTDVLTIKELAPVDAFLAKKINVQRVNGNTVEPDISGPAPSAPSIDVLNYK